MNREMTQNLQEALQKQLNSTQYEIVDLVAIPQQGDPQAQLRTLHELFEESVNASSNGEGFQFLLQVKAKSATPTSVVPVPPSIPETVYLPDGKLNRAYLLKNAEVLMESGDYSLARNIFQALITQGDPSGAALLQLGKCLEKEEKFEDARACYEDSIAFNPALETYRRLIQLLTRMKKDQRAAEVTERALNLKVLSPETRFLFLKESAHAWSRANQLENAEKNFKKALEIQPTADDIRSTLGSLYLKMKQYPEAKRSFRDALASNPQNSEALSGLGSCAHAEKDFKSAHEYLCQSLNLEINQPLSIFYLVRCAYELKSYASAAKYLNDFIEVAAPNANIYYSLAGLQFHLGRMQDAKKSVLKTFELQPDHTGAKELLTRIERYSEPPANSR
jgi:tetratricopeptide (TPR) repeat protein